MKFKVIINTFAGPVQHVIRAENEHEAAARALRAHPKGEIVSTKRMGAEVPA